MLLYIKHKKNIVAIDTGFGRGPNKDLALTTVGHVITVCATEPYQGLLGLPANTPLRLYLPDNLPNNEGIDVVRNEDESLFPYTSIEEISRFTNGPHPLVIKPRKLLISFKLLNG